MESCVQCCFALCDVPSYGFNLRSHKRCCHSLKYFKKKWLSSQIFIQLSGRGWIIPRRVLTRAIQCKLPAQVNFTRTHFGPNWCRIVIPCTVKNRMDFLTPLSIDITHKLVFFTLPAQPTIPAQHNLCIKNVSGNLSVSTNMDNLHHSNCSLPSHPAFQG